MVLDGPSPTVFGDGVKLVKHHHSSGEGIDWTLHLDLEEPLPNPQGVRVGLVQQTFWPVIIISEKIKNKK